VYARRCWSILCNKQLGAKAYCTISTIATHIQDGCH
jgi:hypothetical protein